MPELAEAIARSGAPSRTRPPAISAARCPPPLSVVAPPARAVCTSPAPRHRPGRQGLRRGVTVPLTRWPEYFETACELDAHRRAAGVVVGPVEPEVGRRA